jgi:hypothetical protein
MAKLQVSARLNRLLYFVTRAIVSASRGSGLAEPRKEVQPITACFVFRRQRLCNRIANSASVDKGLRERMR